MGSSVTDPLKNVHEDIFEVADSDLPFREKLAILKRSAHKTYFFVPHWENPDVRKRLTECLRNTPRFRQSGPIGASPNVRFSWETVLLFGSDRQKQAFNRFRTQYIDYLVSRHCNSLSRCKYAVAGTPAELSALSDMDYNFEGPGMRSAMDKIAQEHSMYFDADLNEVFDANMYGTTFKFHDHKDYVMSDLDYRRQQVWSFSRVAEVLALSSHVSNADVQAFRKALSDRHDALLSHAVTLAKSCHHYDSSDCYEDRLNRFARLRADVVTADAFSDTLESFSRAKIHENETYRTFGAVLHVVEGLKRGQIADPRFFEHSACDNFGFFVQTMCKKLACREDDDRTAFFDKVLKASKYIHRTCDALLQLRPVDAGTLAALLYVSGEANEARRTTDSLRKRKAFENLTYAIMHHRAHHHQQPVGGGSCMAFVVRVYNATIVRL